MVVCIYVCVCVCVCVYRYVCVLSRFSPVLLFAALWTVALQAPLSMGVSRQEYWSGLLSPPPGDLPDPVLEPMSPESAYSAGDPSLIPGLERSSGEGMATHSSILQLPWWLNW